MGTLVGTVQAMEVRFKHRDGSTDVVPASRARWTETEDDYLGTWGVVLKNPRSRASGKVRSGDEVELWLQLQGEAALKRAFTGVVGRKGQTLQEAMRSNFDVTGLTFEDTLQDRHVTRTVRYSIDVGKLIHDVLDENDLGISLPNPKQGLVVWHKCDDAAGSVVLDSSGNGRNAVMENPDQEVLGHSFASTASDRAVYAAQPRSSQSFRLRKGGPTEGLTLRLKKVGAPTGTVTVRIGTARTATGTYAETTFAAEELGTAYADKAALPAITIPALTTYYVTVEYSGGDPSNFIAWEFWTGSQLYDGQAFFGDSGQGGDLRLTLRVTASTRAPSLIGLATDGAFDFSPWFNGLRYDGASSTFFRNLVGTKSILARVNMRARVFDGHSYTHVFATRDGASGTASGYAFTILNDGKLRYSMGNGTVGEFVDTATSIVPNFNQTYEVGMSYNATTGEVVFYVDKEEVGRGTFPTLRTAGVGDRARWFNDDGSGSEAGIDGQVDELRMYDRVLSGNEFRARYYAGHREAWGVADAWGANVKDMVFDYVDYREFLTRLSEVVSATWHIDAEKRLHFIPRGHVDSGILETGATATRFNFIEDSESVQNVVRGYGGTNKVLHAAQSTITTYERITASTTKSVKLRWPREELPLLDLYLKSVGGSNAAVEVRIEADDGTGNASGVSLTRFIVPAADVPTAGDWVAVFFPRHTIGPGSEVHVIVQATTTQGVDVGVDAGGIMAHKAYVGYPVAAEVTNADSIATYGRREGRPIRDSDINNQEELLLRLNAHLAKFAYPARVGSFRACAPAYLTALLGSYVTFELPEVDPDLDGAQLVIKERAHEVVNHQYHVDVTVALGEREREMGNLLASLARRLEFLEASSLRNNVQALQLLTAADSMEGVDTASITTQTSGTFVYGTARYGFSDYA